MISRGKLNKGAFGILVTVFVLFWFAPAEFVEFLLKTLTYHPWRLCIGIAVVLGLYIWLAYTAYFNTEEPRSEPVERA
jgi:hypothetical protein